MTLQEEQRLEEAYVMPTFARKPVEFVEGSGMVLTDDEGNEYLDFLSGIGVCSLGHCHPAVVAAITEQAHKLIHVSNYYYIEKRGEVARTLSDLLDSHLAEDERKGWKSFFANSGAEANECAIKLARLYAKTQAEATGKDAATAPSIIVTLTKSFHGRTLATVAATGQRIFHKGFEPMPEGFVPTPINDVDALEQLFNQLGSSICAIMIEPIQGESGVHVCTEEFLSKARALTQETGALLIFDEVQSGIYRTGKPYAFQNYTVTPDVVTMAKGIGGGVPAAACAARGDIADVMQPGKHGTTFGGSNIAIAAMSATLAELGKPGVCQSIIEVGDYLQGQLSELKGVQSVRGIGLMTGVDLIDELDAPSVVATALEEKLVINATGPHTLRFLPPLICTKADVDEAIIRLKAALEKQSQG